MTVSRLLREFIDLTVYEKEIEVEELVGRERPSGFGCSFGCSGRGRVTGQEARWLRT